MAGFNAFLKNNNIITGTAIPTEGNFKTGDIIVNVGPNSAIEPMWICNEGGNPGIWGPVGVGSGSGSIVSINSSVLISEPTNEVPLDSLGVGVSSKDKLLVHYNSTHLLEGVHFEISNDGSKIVKLTEGNWNEDGEENCIFALELFKGVKSIDGDKIVVDSKMTSITNHVVIENACSEVEIGIEGFNAGNDMMLVFKNGVNMVEGVDYEVQDGKIVSTGEVWNENGLEDYGMTFVVFKEVVEYNGDAEVKAENIADGSIGMNKLADDVKGAIEEASNIDLSGYVEQEEYNGKIAELEGKVNEAFTNANNGKQLIANAIGEPVSAEDTFSAMSNDINGLLSTFKTNMMNNGVTVESGDRFKSLIDKIATMVEEGEGKGIQIASGSATATSNYKLNVTGLNFKPQVVFAQSTYAENVYSIYVSFDTYSKSIYFDPQYRVDYQPTITNNGFTITTGVDNNVHNWYAIGVGEEDTTLRDSLASILQEEGVSVTEEDDMASLISKVDEEFDRQVVPAGDAVAANVLTGKTFINSTGQTITGTMANRGGAQTITPGTSNKTLNAGYYSGNITVTGDADLVAANILSGKNIFGVAGTATASYSASGTATATSNTVTVTGLGFKPKVIFLKRTTEGSSSWERFYYVNIGGIALNGMVRFTSSTYSFSTMYTATVNSDGFTFKTNSSTSYDWYAFN